ncbi:MAG: hypothetical protein ACNFW9_03410 [Candidatus Kerfeldbacteria bacterium]
MRHEKYFIESTGEVKLAKIIFHVFGLICLIVLLSFVGKVVFFPAQVAQEIAEETFDGSRMIYVYEDFFNKYEAAKATAIKVKNHQRALDDFKFGHPDPDNWDYNDRQEYDRLSSMIPAVMNLLADQVGQYNADAAKINRAFLKGDKLPDSLVIEELTQ